MTVDLARAGRSEIETVLDAAGWPWTVRLSRWIDALIALEEIEERG